MAATEGALASESPTSAGRHHNKGDDTNGKSAAAMSAHGNPPILTAIAASVAGFAVVYRGVMLNDLPDAPRNPQLSWGPPPHSFR